MIKTDNIDEVKKKERMLSEDSRKAFINIVKEEWSKYCQIHQFTPNANGGFRGGSVEFIVTAVAHLKKDGSISTWEIPSVEVKDHFRYDV